jgi:hypothetical protein
VGGVIPVLPVWLTEVIGRLGETVTRLTARRSAWWLCPQGWCAARREGFRQGRPAGKDASNHATSNVEHLRVHYRDGRDLRLRAASRAIIRNLAGSTGS